MVISSKPLDREHVLDYKKCLSDDLQSRRTRRRFLFHTQKANGISNKSASQPTRILPSQCTWSHLARHTRLLAQTHRVSFNSHIPSLLLRACVLVSVVAEGGRELWL